ncbi:RGPR-related, putative isoform 1 [Hibiscus syriacus]|uniref:RGPR-related, putative isoform 1 n=1 Tax=Hibiscus syriacus TaxID=106335 RepID=A0A6A3CG74_HIBSY|nr:RGPR-related, putative isoform 1 [Hibiscus syriacus]
MEKHKCKIFGRRFSNGRALGTHMRSHLTNQSSNRSDSASSSSSSSGEEQEKGNGIEFLAYGLRENPKKSFRFADPEFSFAPDSGTGSVVQDRERERERDRVEKPNSETIQEKTKDGSVSDTSLEEDVAMCLMLLSRDAWKRNNVERKSHKRVGSETKKPGKVTATVIGVTARYSSAHFVAECSGRDKLLAVTRDLIRSLQLLHQTMLQIQANLANSLIDLNLPPPLEDDEFSVVSDA